MDKCTELNEVMLELEQVKAFIGGIMSDPELLTSPETSVFETGQKFGWTADAIHSNVLATLAVEIASEKGTNVSEKTDWITQRVPMQSILQHAFFLQKEKESLQLKFSNWRKGIATPRESISSFKHP